MTDPIVEALDKFVPAFQSVEGDWQAVLSAAAVHRATDTADGQSRDPLGWAALRGRRPRRRLRLAVMAALIFLLLSGVATATYWLIRGNGSLGFQGGDGKLLVVDPHGLRTIARCPGDSSGCEIIEPAWSPDGKHIAFLRARYFGHKKSQAVLYVAAADGRGPRRLAACGLCGDQWGSRLGWSPDGKWIAFSRDAGPRGQESLWFVAAAGGSPHRLTDCSRCADVQPTWSPDGQVVVFVRAVPTARTWIDGLYTVRPDGSGLTQVAPHGSDPEWSPDGRRIAFDSGPDSVAVVNADGSQLRVLLAGARGTGPGAPSWSPDGRKLVFFETPGHPAHFVAEVWTMNADGSGKKRLYRSGCCVGLWAPPVWSPDGRQIAFSADSAGGTFVMNADGSGLRRVSPSPSDSLSWQQRPK